MRGCVAILFVLMCALSVPAAQMELKMADGTTMKGDIELTAPNASGIILKLDGQPQPRTEWNKFSEATLREFQKDSRFAKFVTLLVTPDLTQAPPVTKSKAKSVPAIKPVDHPARITPRPSIFAGIFTPLGFIIFASFWGTSIYAGYEIARYREQPIPLVCGVSAVIPVIGPIVFLCLKPKEKGFEPLIPEPVLDRDAVPDNSATATESNDAAAAGQAPAPEPAAPVIPQTLSFKRGDYTFNRRFVETKFAPFFRLVPAESEKDLLLLFKTARGEFTGRRISKVTQNDLQLVVQKDDVFTDVTIPLNDILEVQVRHKDAPA